MIKFTCLSCNGSGQFGTVLKYVLPCPYCNGIGYFDTKEAQRSAGLCSGKLRREGVQLDLFDKGVYL